jgi:hypothetical protein
MANDDQLRAMNVWRYEIQHSWHPGCGWLQSPHANRTWDEAWNEAKQYAVFAFRNGIVVSVRVTRGKD